MKKIGIIGFRGMVGSVLCERMLSENDHKKYDIYLFSSSLAGSQSDLEITDYEICDAFSIDQLSAMDALISCQGGDYTSDIHPKLRDSGWSGYWVDASSNLRMSPDSCLILDPVNKAAISNSIDSGIKDFIGANCTVSLLLLGLGQLIHTDNIEWITSHTYQAASGGGAKAMKELLKQSSQLSDVYSDNLSDNVLSIEERITKLALSSKIEKTVFGSSLALSTIPWIDVGVENGRSKEEWKASVEASKILRSKMIIDGTCVRVSSLRCHGQAVTLKLKKSMSLSSIEDHFQSSHPWLDFIENTKDATVDKLNPLNYSGSMQVGVGRVRKSLIGDEYINLFTIGDQLLWGAAEPLRRFLHQAF